MDCVAEVDISLLPDALLRDPWCAGVPIKKHKGGCI